MAEKTSTPTPEPTRAARFLSLRWRFITPLFAAVLILAVTGAYFAARNLSGGIQISQESLLLESSRAVAQRAAALYERQRTEAQRTAFTVGVPEAMRAADAERLEPLLQSLARVGGMDAVIVTAPDGQEILGVQRVQTGGTAGYAVSTGTDLSDQAVIRAVLDEAYVGATGLMRTPGGLMLFTATPVSLGDEFTGIALVGQHMETVLAELRGSALADLAFYGPDGILMQTTFPAGQNRAPLAIPPEVFTQALLAVQQIPVRAFSIETQPYQAAYQPFNYGPNTLGVVAALMPDNIPYVTETGRQLTALMAAFLAGGVVIVAFVAISRVAARAEKVTAVAHSLARGERARTAMKASDEIGALGQALDQYADYAQEKQDALRHQLRRQRREVSHLMAVLESLPDGVLVQDLGGRVVVVNEYARTLLGTQIEEPAPELRELTAQVQEILGPALAPGIYALGDPQRIHLGDKMLSAQAAAIMSMTGHRLGTVIVLRDISDHVRQERERELLLNQLAQEIQQPLSTLGRTGAGSQSSMVNAFAREVTRHAIALQKMILDMRELSNVDVMAVQRVQRPLRLETLLWAVANEWRQVAQASGLTLHVIIERKGLYVLGDEKRLRWAIGSVVDNAIKYTLPGGALTLEIKDESDSMANLRIRDNGVGIAREERPHVFTRFYRGTPVAPDGRVIRVPGMGQGLYITRQIFEAHGGRVHFKSTPGVGTAVYMSLPLTSAVSMDIPQFAEDMDGETIRLPVDFLVELDQD